MPRYNDVPKQWSPEATSQGREVCFLLPLPVLVAAIVLTLASLACVSIGTGSQSIADITITRLPTLTRTPLPTLTPTASGATPAAAMPADPAATAPAAAAAVVSPDSASVNPAEAPAVSSNPAQATTSGAVSPPVPSSAPAAPPVSGTIPLTNPSAVAPAATPVAVLNPTPIPTLAGAATATPIIPTPTVAVGTATATPTLTPTSTPAATVTPTPGTAGWAFASVRVGPNPDGGGLILYGEVINNTGSSQELALVSGNFYDGQGQIIANEENTANYAPVDIVPPGGRVPFELSIDNVQNVADFDLWAQSEASGDVPRQDFEFLEVSQWTEDEDYCLSGSLRNPGGPLQDYLIIVAILYDGQGNVINFGDDYQTSLEGVAGDETLYFEICANLSGQSVARHELRAWGR